MATKKVVAKKSEPKKAAAAKKSEPKKAAAAKKAVRTTKKSSTAAGAIAPILPLPVSARLEGGIEFQNTQQNQAFLFAERMKRKQREGAAKEAAKQAEVEDDIPLKRRPTTRERGTVTEKFSDTDLAEFRKTLLALRSEANSQSKTLRANALEQADERVAEGEDGTDSSIRLQSLGQLDAQHRNIQLIDDALRRIDEGTYGICEECGLLIRKPRLLHLPFARTCMECQRAKEGK